MRRAIPVHVVKLEEFNFSVVAAAALAVRLPAAVMGEHLAPQPVIVFPGRERGRVFSKRVRHGAPSAAVLWNTRLA